MSSRPTPHSQDTILAESTASSPMTSPSTSSGASSSLPGGSSSAPVVLAGRYELLALVGVGGMGTVYRARDLELDDVVALKVLRPEVVATPGMLDRFRRELKLARRVTHRNVARAHDMGEDKDQRFLTMEYIDGEPLAQQLLRRQGFSSKRIVEIARAVCQGLSAAHAVGVIHCDLKPENILVGNDDRIVITDFGIARGVFDAGLRKTLGAVLGTPAYMAPEQVEGSRDLTAAADLYALGVMLFELFTGDLPWRGDSVFSVAIARLHQAPPDPRTLRPELPEELVQVLLRCLARRPSERYQTAEELERALSSLRLDGLHTGPVPSIRATRMSPMLAPEPAGKAVAVLPFRNAGSPDDAYLVDGLVEDLIDQLSMTQGLRVRPRGAVMHLAGSERDARELGRELGVQVVVEGSLRRAGDRLRLNARLISVADGFQLWARRFDSTPAGVLSLSDELAQAVAEALTVAAQPDHKRAAPTDPRALEAYFRGRFEYHKYTPEDLTRAVSYLEEAKTLAPNDPMILAGYALACTRHWFFGTPGRSEQAREAAERAIQLAPQRAEPLVALASHLFFTNDVPGAVRLLRKAIQLNPDLPDAHDLLGKILIESGPVRRGCEHLERAAQTDPAFRHTLSNVPRAMALEGRIEEAFAYIERIREDASHGNNSAWVTFARLVVWTMDRERALEYRDHPGIQSTVFSRDLLDYVVEPSDRFLAQFATMPAFTSPHATWRGRALFHQGGCEFAASAGKVDDALRALQAALQEGLFDLLWVDGCPLLAPLRNDPRFQAVREKVAERARLIRAEMSLP